MSTMSMPISGNKKTWLDRLMSLVTEVQPGEALTALLLTLNGFLLLATYYIIRPVREALILADGGAEIRSYLGAVLAVLFLLIVPGYGAFASKVNRIRLINSISLLFISNLVVFYLLGRVGVRLGIPFFL
jgi:AAA family ATP:ADP antiporter